MRKLLLSITIAVCASNSFAYYQAQQGRWLNRDPIDEDGGKNLYAYTENNPIIYIDPLGLELKGSMDSYIEMFLGNNPWMDESQKQWTTDQLNRGCIGVVCAHLGHDVKLDTCFKLKKQADQRKEQMKKDCDCGSNEPTLYSVHLRNDRGSDDSRSDVPFGPTSQAEMSNWNFSARPNPENWHPDGAGANVFYFDFSVLLANGQMMGADRSNHPEQGKPGNAIMRSMAEWKKLPADFNQEVWCVECDGGGYGK